MSSEHDVEAAGTVLLRLATAVLQFTVAVDDLARVGFVAADGAATDSFSVRGSDGTSWSDWQTATVTTVASTGTMVAGGEMLVSGGTDAQVAELANGRHVVVWLNGGDVYGQLYAADGSTVRGEFLVNNTYSLQTEDSVSLQTEDSVQVVALDDGGFVIGWRSSGTTISGRLYDASGTALGSEILLGSDASASITSLSLTALADGAFVAGWQAGTTVETALFNRYGARVDGYSIATGAAASEPVLATLPSGNLVQVWTAAADTVQMQIFGADGTAVSAALTVSQAAGTVTAATAAVQDDGTIFVAWSQTDGSGDSSGAGVYGRLYSADGTALGDAILINGTTNGDQTDPDVVALTDGGWLVSWTSSDGSGAEAYARRFDAVGTAVTGDFQLNQTTSGDQTAVSLTWFSGVMAGTRSQVAGRHLRSGLAAHRQRPGRFRSPYPECRRRCVGPARRRQGVRRGQQCWSLRPSARQYRRRLPVARRSSVPGRRCLFQRKPRKSGPARGLSTSWGKYSSPGRMKPRTAAGFLDLFANADGRVERFDLQAYTDGKSRQRPPRLVPGDAVFVPEKTDMNEKSWLKVPADRAVGVMGAVARPGRYEWSDEMSLFDLLSHAGGPTARADMAQIQILPDGSGGRRRPVVFDLARFLDQGGSLAEVPVIRAGTTIVVPECEEDAADAKAPVDPSTGGPVDPCDGPGGSAGPLCLR